MLDLAIYVTQTHSFHSPIDKTNFLTGRFVISNKIDFHVPKSVISFTVFRAELNAKWLILDFEPEIEKHTNNLLAKS